MMTPLEQRLRLAEKYIGKWTEEQLLDDEYFALINGRWATIPRFCTDLNAVHEVEKLLTMGELVKYMKFLNRMELLANNYVYVQQVICATASQRCEALCRVWFPNNWKD